MLKQSVIECLDRMERTIESSGRMLFSGKRIVDGVELLELIDRIRIALPEEMRQAEALQSGEGRFIQLGADRKHHQPCIVGDRFGENHARCEFFDDDALHRCARIPSMCSAVWSVILVLCLDGTPVRI